MRCHAGHPSCEDVVVGEEDVLWVPVVDAIVGCDGCKVGHGGCAETLERSPGQVDHVLFGLTDPDGVPDHSQDEAKPAKASQYVVLEKPWLLVLVQGPSADFSDGIFTDAEEWDHFVLSSRQNPDPIVDNSLQAEQIAHCVGEC